MSMKARYTVIDKEIVGQNRGGVRHIFTPDPSGNVAALYDTNHSKTDTLSYWPYGEEKTRTGPTVTPFTHIGSKGYYADSTSRSYVRARHLHRSLGRWGTKDPTGAFGGDSNEHRYVANNPISRTDRSGLRIEVEGCNMIQLLRILNHLNELCSKRINGLAPIIFLPIPGAGLSLYNCLLGRCGNIKIVCGGENDPQCIAKNFPTVPAEGKMCGSTSGETIYICPATLAGGNYGGLTYQKCKCLGGVIVHEMVHSCGISGTEFLPEVCSLGLYGPGTPDCPPLGK